MKTFNPARIRAFQLGKYILTGFFVLGFSLYFLYPEVFYCELIALSDFKKVDRRMYFSPEIKKSQYRRFGNVIVKARARVDSFYQGKVSQPRIIICTSQEQYRKYCSSNEGAGCSIGTPWGSSFVVLSAQGLNADVAAHEMSHVELLKRLGWWKVTMGIPQWFNEGLALMLDRRFVTSTEPGQRYLQYLEEWQYYTGGGQQILELEDITSIKGFYNGDQRQVMRAYMSSGMEVAYWLALSGPGSVSRLIDEVSSGRPFDESYRHVEADGRGKITGRLPSNPLRLDKPGKMVH